MANQLDEYNIKLNSYIKNIPTSKYLIELTKCCNYSEFLTVYKKKSLKDLYTDVKYHYDHLNITNLYILINNEKIIIPNNENIILYDYINNNKNYFIPVYQVPSQIVYKIYLDYANNNCIKHCVNSEQNMIQDMDIDSEHGTEQSTEQCTVQSTEQSMDIDTNQINQGFLNLAFREALERAAYS